MNNNKSPIYITHNEISTSPWFISTCTNRNIAAEILGSCSTIEDGNFLVRPSENNPGQSTITIWFSGTVTHIRINRLHSGQYQLDHERSASFQMPTFATLKDLIDYFREHEMKLIGHSQGYVKLKFNPNIFNNTTSEKGGVLTYGSH